jgi:hypothetical protein
MIFAGLLRLRNTPWCKAALILGKNRHFAKMSGEIFVYFFIINLRDFA